MEDDQITSMNTSNCKSDRSSPEECFVVDIDYLSSMGNQRSDTTSSTSNSSSTAHRSFSRIGFSSSSSHQRGGKALLQQTQNDTSAANAAGGVGGEVGEDYHHQHHESCNKGIGRASLMTTGASNKQAAIIVVGGGDGGVAGATTGTGTCTENINNSSNNTKTVKETVMVRAESSRWKRYNSIKQQRSSSSLSSWTVDPRRILLFFATLSSIGTIILIYFTLSMTKLDEEDIPAVSHSHAP